MTTRRMAWLLAGIVEPEEDAELEREKAMAKSTSGPATGSDAIAGTAAEQKQIKKKRAASFLRQLLVTVRGTNDLFLTSVTTWQLVIKCGKVRYPPFFLTLTLTLLTMRVYQTIALRPINRMCVP